MTAQIAERLRYQEQDFMMCTEPLKRYLETSKFPHRFLANCTALWRGYVGSWKIREGKLYLVELDGMLDNRMKASVAMFFPDNDESVFASWFSGTLRIPQGRQLQYVHAGYGSVYESDIFINVVDGEITGTSVEQNGVASSEDSPKGYGVGAQMVFPLAE